MKQSPEQGCLRRRMSAFICLLAVGGCGGPANGPAAEPANGVSHQPNIVILYADDLGYGDVGVYGATAVDTPHIDRLAASGIQFTDAHSTAATCTPSRFSLLTGRHGFRNDSAILPGDAPLLIRPGTPTVASMLGDAGYRTAIVGKWHLGLGNGDVDWNGDIGPGPLDVGFDYSFLLPATGDRVPTVFIEQRRVVGLDPTDPITISYGDKVGDRPTGVDNPELLRVRADRQHSDSIVNGVSRIGFMAGEQRQNGSTKTCRTYSQTRRPTSSKRIGIRLFSCSIRFTIFMYRDCLTNALTARPPWGRAATRLHRSTG